MDTRAVNLRLGDAVNLGRSGGIQYVQHLELDGDDVRIVFLRNGQGALAGAARLYDRNDPVMVREAERFGD